VLERVTIAWRFEDQPTAAPETRVTYPPVARPVHLLLDL
jgi:hypothetical protein